MRTVRVNLDAIPLDAADDLARAAFEAEHGVLDRPDGNVLFGEDWYREMVGDEHSRGER